MLLRFLIAFLHSRIRDDLVVGFAIACRADLESEMMWIAFGGVRKLGRMA
jgi:hypothetical protein